MKNFLQITNDFSIVPINTAHVTLDCHRPDKTHFVGFYRPCEKQHVEQKYATE